MTKDDIAFKSNFAFINEETGIVERRRVDREFDWGIPLCDLLDGMQVKGYPEVTISCKYATEHRCGFMVNAPGLDCSITGTDPLKDFYRQPQCEAIDFENESSVYTAKLVQTISDQIREMLNSHPINVQRKAEGKTYTNILLLRGCG